MKEFWISEETADSGKLDYLKESVGQNERIDKESKIIIKGGYAVFNLSVYDENALYVKKQLIEGISDIICISYKYDVFSNRLKGEGLSGEERDILLSAVIAADFEDDKRFVKSKIKFENEFSISGFYNFRLQKLLNKWEEIANYVPNYFTAEDLAEFVGYLINEKKGRRVYVDGNKIYDGKYKTLNKTSLLPKLGKNRLLREALLAGAGEICFLTDVLAEERIVFEKFFSNKIINITR